MSTESSAVSNTYADTGVTIFSGGGVTTSGSKPVTNYTSLVTNPLVTTPTPPSPPPSLD